MTVLLSEQDALNAALDQTAGAFRFAGPTLLSYDRNGYSNGAIIKVGPGTLYSIVGYSNNGATQYILLFDSATIPGDGAVPRFIIPVPSKGNFTLDGELTGIKFVNGIVWCNSSTASPKAIGSADCSVNAQYL